MKKMLIAIFSSLAFTVFANDLKIIKKVPPEFPEEAIRKKVTEGVIKAKLTVDGGGSVTNVEVVEATPPKAKIFSEAAIAALKLWKFEPSKGGEVEIKLVFSEE